MRKKGKHIQGTVSKRSRNKVKAKSKSKKQEPESKKHSSKNSLNLIINYKLIFGKILTKIKIKFK